MRKPMPHITESADELQRRMKNAPDLKKRQRLHAFYLAASGQARHRQEIAALLGVHRHSVAAYAEGGGQYALHYQVPRPPTHPRITATALTALQDKLTDPQGFAGYQPIRLWLAEEHQVTLAYASVHALVRYKLRAKPKPPTSITRKKNSEAVTQFQTALPTVLTQQAKEHAAGGPVKVFAQDETRLGLLPVVRRRITAGGVQPVATVTHQCDNFYLYGAVEPTTGASFFLELPYLNSRAFQVWLNGFAATFPASLNVVVLDNGAGHKAKAVRWPSNVVPVFLPPYSPELNPIERFWRDLKDKLAALAAQTLDALSDAVCSVIQHYAPTTLHSLTSFPYFVQAVATAQQARYG